MGTLQPLPPRMAPAAAARTRRLARLLAQLGPAQSPAAAAEEVGEPGEPGVVRRWHEGGDGQGYGPRASEQPRAFKPSELEEALAFFRRERFVLIDDALSAAELDFLNGFCERSQAEKSAAWGIPDDGDWSGGIYLQPLLDHPELDPFMQVRARPRPHTPPPRPRWAALSHRRPRCVAAPLHLPVGRRHPRRPGAIRAIRLQGDARRRRHAEDGLPPRPRNPHGTFLRPRGCNAQMIFVRTGPRRADQPPGLRPTGLHLHNPLPLRRAGRPQPCLLRRPAHAQAADPRGGQKNVTRTNVEIWVALLGRSQGMFVRITWSWW